MKWIHDHAALSGAFPQTDPQKGPGKTASLFKGGEGGGAIHSSVFLGGGEQLQKPKP